MKTFSRHWTSSTSPRKQRKYRYHASLHLRRRMLEASLSRELRKKHGRRNAGLRKGDRVKAMRGEFRNRIGKIESVDIRNYKVYIEGIERVKRDGTKVRIGIPASKVQIIELNLDDKQRKKKMETKKVLP